MPATCQSRQQRRAGAGFTLIEVLIALLVTTSGVLGLAKMQTLAISSTRDSGIRSLVALQAGSLAAVMHANPVFWRDGTPPASFTATGTRVTDATHTVDAGASFDCAKNPCNPQQLAASDVKSWVEEMNKVPTYEAKVDCPAASGISPISCVITVSWYEKVIAMNKSTADGATERDLQSFTEHVNP